MIARKEIIVLNGGGHKGIVKISGASGRDAYAKISCSLDFRPNGAKLYLIGDNIAQIELKDTNCVAEIPFSASKDVGCVLRSSSVTMFGGSGAKSEMLQKVDGFIKEQSIKRIAEKEKTIEQDDKSRCEANAKSNAEKEADDGGASENLQKEHCVKESAEKPKRSYVGVASKSDADVLGEWTKYDGNNFYYAVKPQLDEMFVCYPEEETLRDTVPNSKWVKVDAEDGYYVVGLLYDDDEPSFICYGVPQHVENGGNYQAPAELQNMCVWLPVQVDESIAGYWIIYQSAKTGEIIK